MMQERKPYSNKIDAIRTLSKLLENMPKNKKAALKALRDARAALDPPKADLGMSIPLRGRGSAPHKPKFYN